MKTKQFYLQISLCWLSLSVHRPVAAQSSNDAKLTLPASSTTMATTGTSARSTNSEDAKAVNGFAMQLRPTVKRASGARDVAYAPVRQVEDLGQTPEIEMFVGESRVLPAPGVGRIAVGNGRIMTAAVLDKREILLFANEQGTSSLFIWNEDGRYQRLKINIVPGDTSRIGREIAAFLSSMPGAKASIVGDKVIVEGDRLSDRELEKIKKLEGTYPQIVNFTNTQSWEKMVMMDVKVVEFPKTEMQELGLKWTPTGGGAIGAVWLPVTKGHNGPYQVNIPTGGTGSQGGLPITDVGQTGVSLHSALNIRGAFDIGLNATLNALAQNGKAAVLAEPQLSARSGAKAKFLAGGEFPYVVSTITGPVVSFKEYGIKLDIEPKIDRDGYIRAKILTEVSSIDASVSTSEGPALKKRSTETEFNVRSGETIVLSGMLNRDSNTSVDKVPYLGDIPVLGALFRSRRYQNNETELVVFVTPTVVDAQSPEQLDRIEKTKEKLEQQLGKAPYLTEPLQPTDLSKSLNKIDMAASSPVAQLASASALRALPPALVPVPLEPPVEPGSNATVYVSADKNPLTMPAKNGPAFGANLKVKLEGLALRSSPDMRSPVLMQLGEGAIVQLAAQEPAPSLAGIWRQVRVGQVVGWVAAQWVVPAVKDTSTESKIGPMARQAQLGRSLNDVPMVTQAKPLIQRGKSSKDQVTVSGAAKQYRVVLPKLAVRVAPDVNAAIVTQVMEGSLVRPDAGGTREGWVSVESDGKHGWVAAQWLEPQP